MTLVYTVEVYYIGGSHALLGVATTWDEAAALAKSSADTLFNPPRIDWGAWSGSSPVLDHRQLVSLVLKASLRPAGAWETGDGPTYVVVLWEPAVTSKKTVREAPA